MSHGLFEVTGALKENSHREVAIFLDGGAGGSRTRVRKPSTVSSTCVARPF